MADSPKTESIHGIEKYPDVGMGLVQGENTPDFGQDVKAAMETHGSSLLSSLAEKLIVVGDPAVGKTSLIVRFCKGNFQENYKATIGVDFIWDTAGQETFRSITRAYYRGAKGIIVAFDLTSEDSFSHVRAWAEEARKHVGQECFVWLVGLKSDLTHHVTTAQGCSLAEELKAEYWEVSSKTSSNVTELFARVAVTLFESAVRKTVADGEKPASEIIGDIKTKPKEEKARKDGCC